MPFHVLYSEGGCSEEHFHGFLGDQRPQMTCKDKNGKLMLVTYFTYQTKSDVHIDEYQYVQIIFLDNQHGQIIFIDNELAYLEKVRPLHDSQALNTTSKQEGLRRY